MLEVVVKKYITCIFGSMKIIELFIVTTSFHATRNGCIYPPLAQSPHFQIQKFEWYQSNFSVLREFEVQRLLG